MPVAAEGTGVNVEKEVGGEGRGEEKEGEGVDPQQGILS